MEDLQAFEPLNQLLLTDLTSIKRFSVAKSLLKAVSSLNSMGLFHNNLNAANVMISRKCQVKVHEGDVISRQGTTFVCKSVMMKNPYYGSTIYKRIG
jgi:hypothetical protein